MEALELMQLQFLKANKASMKLIFAPRFGRRGGKAPKAVAPAANLQKHNMECPPTPKRRGSRLAQGVAALRPPSKSSRRTTSPHLLPRPRSHGGRSFGSSDVSLNEAARSPFQRPPLREMKPNDSVAGSVFNLSLLVDECLTAATETVFDQMLCYHHVPDGVDDRVKTVQL